MKSPLLPLSGLEVLLAAGGRVGGWHQYKCWWTSDTRSEGICWNISCRSCGRPRGSCWFVFHPREGLSTATVCPHPTPLSAPHLSIIWSLILKMYCPLFSHLSCQTIFPLYTIATLKKFIKKLKGFLTEIFLKQILIVLQKHCTHWTGLRLQIVRMDKQLIIGFQIFLWISLNFIFFHWFTNGLIISRHNKMLKSKIAANDASPKSCANYKQYRNVYNRVIWMAKKCFRKRTCCESVKHKKHGISLKMLLACQKWTGREFLKCLLMGSLLVTH